MRIKRTSTDSSHAAPLEAAATHLDPATPRARPDETARQVRERLQHEGQRAWDVLCVVDDRERLLGIVAPDTLLAMHDDAAVGEAAQRDLPRVLPGADQERVASVALHHGLKAVPVVDDAGKLLGVVGTAALLNILRLEHVEDLHRLAGISRETRQARQAIESPPLRRARHRLPWLLVGLVGSMLATLVVSRFEQALASKPAIAFFIPGLVYLADAIGTQSEAVAVRGLSLSHVGVGRLLGNEVRTGLLIGAALSLICFPLIWFVFGDLGLAAAVVLALAAASAVATTIGLLLPWLFARLRLDPAYGSGPVATIVQDVLTLLIYFAGVSAILP
jgi:magnesium transporter